VLAHAGFTQISVEKWFADGIGREVVEHIYKLDR
jgi:hypothetical protein